jgi:serine kinase of HPr protein (carbohydrate metabolism regulator)
MAAFQEEAVEKREAERGLARPGRPPDEIRGLGLRRLAAHAPAAVLRLVVDLVAEAERLPETAATAMLLGVALPRLALEPRHPHEYLILEALRAMRRQPAKAEAADLDQAGEGRVGPGDEAAVMRLQPDAVVADEAGMAAFQEDCVLLDEAGVLIRGPSGSGKSALCLALLDRAGAR